MSLQSKLFLYFLVIAFIPMTIIGIFSMSKIQNELTSVTIDQLSSIADVQEKRVNEVLDRYLDEIKPIASQTQLRLSLKAYEETGNPKELKKITTIITEAKSAVSAIRAISITDEQETIVASTDETRIGKPLSLFRREKGHPKPVISYHLHEIFKDDSNVLHVRLHGPVNLEGEKIGLVEIESTANDFVAVTEDYTGLGKTGEVLLAKKNQAGDGFYLSPLRFDAGAALNRAVSKEKTNIPVTHALLGEERTFIEKSFVDYRGEPVFAVTRFINALDWGLVAKIDQEEALSPIVAFRNIFLFVVLFVLLTITALSLFISNTIVSPITKLTLRAQVLQRGDFSVRVNIKSKDEIGFLASTFNDMAVKLQDLYHGLEQKVSDRTSDLKNRTDELEKAQTASLNILEDLNNERNALAQTKAKDEAMLASIGDGVVAVNKQGKLIFINKAAEDMLGWSAKDIGKRPWHEVVDLEDENSHSIPFEKRPVGVVLTTTTTTTAYFVRKDKTKFPATIVASAVILDHEVIGAIIAFHDITREKEIDKAKTEFLSIASHELRAPLGIIKAFTSMIFDGDFGTVNDKLQDPLKNIASSTERLIRLVNDMLNLSRIEAERLLFKLSEFPIDRLIKEAAVDFEVLAKEKGIAIVVENVDKAIVQGDQDKVREILNNLIGNASKFTDKGTITISSKQEKEIVTIFVADTGIGIAREDHEKIFGKFQQISSQERGRPRGTGLGLYISYLLAQKMGGKVWLENSTLGKGSVFAFSLPICSSKTAQKAKKTLEDEAKLHSDQKSKPVEASKT